MTSQTINFNFINEELASQLSVNEKGEAILRSKNKIKACFKVLIIPETIIIPKRLISVLEKFVKKAAELYFPESPLMKLLNRAETPTCSNI